MESNVYLTAVNDLSEDGNFYRTVINGIKYDENIIGLSNYKNNLINIWGITEKSTSTFEKIEIGSFILFYNK